jgi:uncharacterized protein (TIGR03435 family)
MRQLVAVALTGVSVFAPLWAQPAAPQGRPSFELASIRATASVQAPTPAQAPGGLRVLADGRLEARGITLVDLARVAYGFERVKPGDVVTSRAGRWAERDRFDVTAATDRAWTQPPPGDRLPVELRLMLRSLLEDRFAIEARVERRRLSASALRLVEPGKLGPMLKPSSNECLGPYDTPAETGDAKPRCPTSRGPDRVEVHAITMAEFVQFLSGIFPSGPPMVDDTGLKGRYDVVVTTGLRKVNIIGNVATMDDVKTLQDFPTVFREVMSNQLGLELKSTKMPMPTLVIERAQRPALD